MYEKILVVALLVWVSPGCVRTHSTVELKPVEVKPIHITVDVNLRIAKELDSFFDDLDAADPTLRTADPK